MQKIIDILKELDFISDDLYAVGGCVRDSLLGKSINDIDICSERTPEEVIALCTNKRYKVIETGVDHGTVTIISDSGEEIEHTTYRKDVSTDGRRATVAYSRTPYDDSLRRDFTINALYMDKDLNIIDHHNGINDIKNRKLNTIDSATLRYQEDYLRILRALRFSIAYGLDLTDNNKLVIEQLSENIITNVSKERILDELNKLLFKYNSVTTANALNLLKDKNSLFNKVLSVIFKDFEFDFTDKNINQVLNSNFEVFLVLLFRNRSDINQWPVPSAVKKTLVLLNKLEYTENKLEILWQNRNNILNLVFSETFSILFNFEFKEQVVRFENFSKTGMKKFPSHLQGKEIGEWQKREFFKLFEQ